MGKGGLPALGWVNKSDLSCVSEGLEKSDFLKILHRDAGGEKGSSHYNYGGPIKGEPTIIYEGRTGPNQ